LGKTFEICNRNFIIKKTAGLWERSLVFLPSEIEKGKTIGIFEQTLQWAK